MNTMCELLDQYMFARTSTTGNGQTDIITTVYLFVCNTCSSATNSETEFVVLDTTYSGKLAWLQKFLFLYCKEDI